MVGNPLTKHVAAGARGRGSTAREKPDHALDGHPISGGPPRVPNLFEARSLATLHLFAVSSDLRDLSVDQVM
jgi:hypothetical protein